MHVHTSPTHGSTSPPDTSPDSPPDSPPDAPPALNTAPLVGLPDLGSVSDEVLSGGAGTIEIRRRRDEALLIHQMIEIEHRRLYAADGHRDLAAWGRAVHRWSGPEARARRNLAALATHCPQVLTRLLAGEIGVAQAHDIGRLFRAPRVGRFVPLFIDQILDAASTFDHNDFELYLSQWRRLVDVDGPDPARAHSQRQASIGFSDHEFRLVVTGPNIDGTKLAALLDEFEQTEFERDWAACRDQYGDDARPDLLRRNAAQRRYDAFIRLLAHVHLPADDTPTDQLEPDHLEPDQLEPDHLEPDEPTNAPPAPLRPVDGAVTTTVNIVIDLRTFLAGAADIFDVALQRHLSSPFGPDRAYSHTLDGTQIAAHDAVLAALHGSFRLVVTDDDGIPIQMTSTSRLFTGRLRDAVMMLAVRCTHPGCNCPATHCHIDHTTPWSHGGTTCTCNGNPACPHHNNWRYATNSTVHHNPNGSWTTTRPDGTDIAPPLPHAA
jgi:hypothetical protein